MTIEQMEGIIEAVLFTMGDSVEVSKLADAIEQDVDTTFIQNAGREGHNIDVK